MPAHVTSSRNNATFPKGNRQSQLTPDFLTDTFPLAPTRTPALLPASGQCEVHASRPHHGDLPTFQKHGKLAFPSGTEQ